VRDALKAFRHSSGKCHAIVMDGQEGKRVEKKKILRVFCSFFSLYA
jgi:hypothetical protein